MKTTKQVKEKRNEIEKELSLLRTKIGKNWNEDDSFKEIDLTEQLMVLRWVFDKNADWNEAGLRDT